ncbi:hypothetical protein RI103_14460 [Paraburkholderia sp. FT54]|jgi:hypothetical protein|uniref:hypothetical protein n=1 Tax=Paraburkholderia sp. FT54 TaxID=3074437 RepID=UPI002877A0BB|nr:hypothetical protein [Paraburkholderia sp. FT54]WNC88885.1 hypothetical protein RI103_14460 [Paraburkholderia sp. FT54]
MKPIKLRVPREEAADLPDDLTAWASVTGIDPGLTVLSEVGAMANSDSPVLYQIYVSQSFFEQFPEWRMYIEQ